MTEQEVKNKMKKYGLTLLDKFQGIKKKHNIIDDNGYKYYNSLDNLIYSNNLPRRFSKTNCYTIDNIKNYIILNNINCELLSNNYNNQKDKLQWKCSCGNIFQKSWGHFQKGQQQCLQCANKKIENAKLKTIEEVKSELLQKELYMIDSTFTKYSDGFYAFTNEGYVVRINKLLLYNDSVPEIIHPLNNYSIYNINRYFELYRNSEYKCLDTKYIGNTRIMNFQHIPCGTIFKSTWSNMRLRSDRIVSGCPKCHRGRFESYHASVLKQIFLHIYPNTILEDRSCINPLSNSVLPTDIVNYELQIAIEIQSAYHDKPYQSIKDNYKKIYWENYGFKFYAIDIRDYSVLEMINIFFPTIYSIPEYIIDNFEDNERYNKAQELIDSSQYLMKDIAKMMNVSINTLYYWNKQNKIKLIS